MNNLELPVGDNAEHIFTYLKTHGVDNAFDMMFTQVYRAQAALQFKFESMKECTSMVQEFRRDARMAVASVFVHNLVLGYYHALLTSYSGDVALLMGTNKSTAGLNSRGSFVSNDSKKYEVRLAAIIAKYKTYQEYEAVKNAN